uniref:Uncharacterized protein n=1 Tax=Tanacetum cinerariifolium TaxID=118510 RepID=A0A6L2N307_TANCI|nr:hypothetical protein [Tanacetum cinerariifolium]
MSSFVLCVGCGEPLYGFSPCQWCTCERCGVDLRDGICPLCNSRNSCVNDPNPNSFDYPPDSYHHPHSTYETYSGDSYGNDSQFGYHCPTLFPLNYEPEPSYIQDYNSYPHNSSSFSQQCLCCDNCRGLQETFQCQSMNQNFYNSNSSSLDQSQTPQFPVIHLPPQETSIKTLRDQENEIDSMQTFLRKFNRISFFETPKVLLLAWDKIFKIKDAFENKQYKPEDTQELFRDLFNDVQNIREELAEYINTPGWNRHAFCSNSNDDDEDNTIASCVENFVPIPSESEDFSDIKSECDMPDCDDSQTTNYSTFSNPLFDDSTSSDDESSHDEFNPIHNEDLDSTPKNDRSDTDSYLLESSLNRDTLMISSLKIDSFLTEFASALIFIESIPPGVDETNCDPEEDIHLVERLLYYNSSPHPPEESNSENSNAEIKSFSPSPIPIEDSNSHMEEIDLSFNSDDPMPPSIEDDENDSEGDNLFLERLLHDDPIPLPDTLEFSNVVRVFLPFFTYPILNALVEAIKDENFGTEDLCGMIKKLEQRTDGTLCLNKRSWIPCRGTQLDMSTAYIHRLMVKVKEKSKPWRTFYVLVRLILGKIKKRIQAARDRQKSYADRRCKPLEFEVRDKVMLKVSPWKGVKCFVDEPLTFPLDEIQIDDKLNFIEEPVEIMEQKVKRLKKIRIPIVKMANGIGFRANSNPEIKRNVQHVKNRNHEQRNQATVQDLWDSCNQWAVVIDVYIAAKRSKLGHRFGFVRLKNVNDINQLVSNLRVTWMGGFHLFVDVAKYGRTNNRLEERSGDNKPNEGMNTQPVHDNANVFQSFNSYAKVVLDKLGDVGFGWNLILRISGKRQEFKDLVGLPLALWALEVYKKLGGRWGCNVFTDMVNDGPLSHGKSAYWAPNIESTEEKSMTDSLKRKDDKGPSSDGGPEHEEPLDDDNCDSVSSKDDNNDSDLSSEMSSTSRLMREVGVRGVDSDHMDSFEEGEIIGDSVLNNDGCVKDCMEKNLDDDVDKDIEDCSKNVSEKCGVVNNNISNNVEGEILEDQFDEDLSSLDRSSDKAERLAHHNNGLDDLDISPRNRLLHQDKCRVRPVKAVVNDSSIVSPSMPPKIKFTTSKDGYVIEGELKEYEVARIKIECSCLLQRKVQSISFENCEDC